MLRLDKTLLPSRNRFATLSTAELDKLSDVKNVIRKGRLGAVTGSALVFLSLPFTQTGEEGLARTHTDTRGRRPKRGSGRTRRQQFGARW